MRKLLFCLLALLLLAASAPACADHETMTIDDFYIEVDTEEKTAVVLDYVGTAENLVIPGKLDGYRVTTVNSVGFKTAPKSLVFSEGIEILKAHSIPAGKQLTHVSLPDSIVTLEGNPFMDCTALSTIEMSENHPALELIDGVLYSKTEKRLIGCLRASNPTQVTIAPGTLSISDHAFYICKTLTSVAIPDSVTSIGENAFYHCSSLQSIDIPPSVRSIGKCAFMYCEAMTFAQLPDRMDEIGGGIFDGCSSLPNIQIYENDKAPEYDPNVYPEMGSTYTERYCDENGIAYFYTFANRP